MHPALLTFLEKAAATIAETSLSIVCHGVGGARKADSKNDGGELHGA
jgi:hypothetical protein